jgi:hypothetical protein
MVERLLMSKWTSLGLVASVLLGSFAGCAGNGVSLGNDGRAGSESFGGLAGSGGSVATAGSVNTGDFNANGGSSGSAGSPAHAGAGGTALTACDNPKPTSGNWIVCENGVYHRTQPGTCVSNLPTAPIKPSTNPEEDECTEDSQCSLRPHGYCSYISGMLPGVNRCSYGCLTDADCSADKICVCGDPVGQCVSSQNCRSDQDCKAGLLCSAYETQPGCPLKAYACQSPTDECASNLQCVGPARHCTLRGGQRICSIAVCAP